MPFSTTDMHLLGLDIGGTKTAVCLGDETGAIAVSRRLPTQAEAGPRAWFERTAALIADVLAARGLTAAQLDAIGVAAPGPMSVARGMMFEPPSLKGWGDVPVAQWFGDLLRRPVHINNDANACALAEWLFGAFRGADSLVYLTLSTGVGGGVVTHGRIVQGAADMAGEIGHCVLDIRGPPCPCGLRGCFEAYCGGLSVARRLRERIARDRIETAILREAGGEPARIDFKALVAAVRQGDAFAREAWDEYVERLAQGIGTVIMTLNPQAIVLGTIAIHTWDLLERPLRERLPRYTWAPALAACAIAPSALDTRIGDLAALAVALTGMQSKTIEQ